MFGPGWQEAFKDENNKAQRLSLIKQIKPILVGLNKAISDRQRDSAVGYTLSLSQAVGQVAGFAHSAAVCDQIMLLMSDVSIALTSPNLDTRVRAMVRVEKWQTDNSSKVIQDWEIFKIMVFNGS